MLSIYFGVMKECWRCWRNAAHQLCQDHDPEPKAVDRDGSTSSLSQRTIPIAAFQYIPMEPPRLNAIGHHTVTHVCSRKKKKRKIDAEVGKAYHMRVARRRQHRSRHYPVSVSTTPQPYPNPWPNGELCSVRGSPLDVQRERRPRR